MQRGLGVHALDQEGRVLTLEFENLYLVNCYTPNSGQNVRGGGRGAALPPCVAARRRAAPTLGQP